MKLHSPEFEKKLRRAIKAARSSPEFSREFRKKTPPRHYSLELLIRPLIAVGLGALIWSAMSTTDHALTGLAVLNLWAAAWILIRTQNVLTNLFSAGDLPALASLPITERDVFRWELSKFYRSSLMTFVDLLIGIGVIAWFMKLSAAMWVAVVPIALFAWALVIAASLFCAARFPRMPYGFTGVCLFLFGLLLFLARDFVLPVLIGFIDRHALTLNVLLPTGWASSLLLMLGNSHHWPVLGLLLPGGLLLSFCGDSLGRLRQGYSFVERVRAEASDLPPDSEEHNLARQSASGTPLRVGITEIEEVLQSRRFLASPQISHRDLFERALYRWFDKRERALVEFVFPHGLPILTSWKRLFRHFAIVVLTAYVLSFFSQTGQFVMLGLGMFFVGIHVLARLVDTGAAFLPVRFSGVNVPIYAAYGIGFRELYRLLLKVSSIQFPMVLAFMACSSLLFVWLGQLPVGTMLVAAFKAAGLLTASRMIFLTFSFSSGTNDSSRWSTVPLLVCIAVFGGLFLLLAGAALFVLHPIGWLFWLLAMLDAYVFLRIYGWFYNSMRFDLMK